VKETESLLYGNINAPFKSPEYPLFYCSYPGFFPVSLSPHPVFFSNFLGGCDCEHFQASLRPAQSENKSPRLVHHYHISIDCSDYNPAGRDYGQFVVFGVHAHV